MIPRAEKMVHHLKLSRVHIENFKSIESLTLELDQTTILVGRNGAGKSNILEALAFLAACFGGGSLEDAIRSHQGIDAIKRMRPAEDGENNLRIELEFAITNLDSNLIGFGYGLCLDLSQPRKWRIKEEWLSEISSSNGKELALHREWNELVVGKPGPDGLKSDRLVPMGLFSWLLANALFTGMRTRRYNFEPSRLRQPQPFVSDGALSLGGENLYALWERMRNDSPEEADRVLTLLRQITPDLQALEAKTQGNYTFLQGRFGDEALEVDAAGFSDGTLRAFALLMAIYQPNHGLMALLEEPELALQPGAATKLLSALLSAPKRPHLLITTHSPHLLEAREVSPEMIRVVEMRDGKTVAGPIHPDQLQEIKDHLVTEQELLEEGAFRLDCSALTKKGSLRPQVKR